MNSSTSKAINAQTSGPLDSGANSPLSLFASPSASNPDGMIAVVRYLGNSSERIAEHEANSRLLAAAYTAFDRAGRELGIDATELAEGLDIASMIRAAACNEHKEVDEWLAANLRKPV